MARNLSRNSAAVPSDDFVITDPAAELYGDTPFESRYGKYSGDAAPEWMNPRHEPAASRIAKGAVAGAIAGLAAGYAMVLFQKVWSSAEKKITGKDEKNLNKNVPEHREHKPGEDNEQSDDATIKTAQAVADVFDHKLTKQEKKVAGPAVHYAFAAAMGALYGGLSEVTDVTRLGFGSAFGAALFVGADEIAVPAFGLSNMPNEVAPSKHIYGLVSHLVYAAATEAVRRPVRKALDKI